MRVSIPMSLTLGLSGQPFNGPDIGGFLENTTPELFGEWIGFGAFFPFSRGHACAGTNQKEPWAFGKLVEKESRMALQRRYRLLPYYYTLFERAHAKGLPVMAPVFFADITDPTLRDEEQAFLIGDDLLVVPSIALNPKLPKGVWETLSLIPNDTKGKYQASLKVRGGAIIPVGAPVMNTEEDSFTPLTLIVCPDSEGNASGSLYWDEGDGWSFRDGNYVRLKFEAHRLPDGKTEVVLTERDGNFPFDLSSVRIQLLANGKTKNASGSLLKNNSIIVK